jgi:hypothetical protein
MGRHFVMIQDVVKIDSIDSYIGTFNHEGTIFYLVITILPELV